MTDCVKAITWSSVKSVKEKSNDVSADADS